jgi:phosphate uptake regulator
MRYFLIAAVSVLAIGCTQSKVSQCNKIIQIANEAVSEAKSVTNSGQTSDPQAMLEAADAMEKASQDMEAIDVRDETLQDYQAGFINMYQNTSQATRDFVTAFEKKDRSAAEAALTNLQQATTPEQQLVEDINTYCSGSTGS